jgi:hypothetical protein
VANAALSSGEITLLETDNPGVYAVMRRSTDQEILVLVNLRGDPISEYQLSLTESLLTDGAVTPRTLFGTIEAIPVTISGGKFSEYKPVDELLPYQSYIFQFE